MALADDTREFLKKQAIARQNIIKRMDAITAENEAAAADEVEEETAKGSPTKSSSRSPLTEASTPAAEGTYADESLDLSPEEAARLANPASIRQPDKPWQRNGRQYRSLTRKEREQEEMQAFDKQALDALDKDRRNSDLDHAGWLLAEKARFQRARDEKRKGTRPLPGSSREDKERGPVIYDSVTFGVDTSQSAAVPLDPRINNGRRDIGSFGGGL